MSEIKIILSFKLLNDLILHVILEQFYLKTVDVKILVQCKIMASAEFQQNCSRGPYSKLKIHQIMNPGNYEMKLIITV